MPADWSARQAITAQQPANFLFAAWNDAIPMSVRAGRTKMLTDLTTVYINRVVAKNTCDTKRSHLAGNDIPVN